jgi:hypothetical protein
LTDNVVSQQLFGAVQEWIYVMLSASPHTMPMHKKHCIPNRVLVFLDENLLFHSSFGCCADVDITYRSSRGGDLDTRLLRANVIKGVLEEITTANVNMVNADLLAEQRGIRITETISKSDSKAIVSDMNVKIGTPKSKFSGAVVGDCITVSVCCC